MYRFGGDGFAAILKLPAREQASVMAGLDQIVAGWSVGKVKSLSVSCGSAGSRIFTSEDIAGLSRISDERMYAAREAYYRNSDRDRRRHMDRDPG